MHCIRAHDNNDVQTINQTIKASEIKCLMQYKFHANARGITGTDAIDFSLDHVTRQLLGHNRPARL